ncbi:NAD(P)H-dependent oxidoreductase [Seonamhaeicola sp. S2-3]|uniref:NAD(P)H-dependent oxidoreductase n=1 Tax=Seonamhaeicola sp. S2-3 TaxID=1936081 RepID=UPI0009727F83|nr:NAD(P)H-dependent oxidoreductase [Seonamhaeicola sp. S2-3]APY12497.1 NAD(P)H-dependent oxidoreductase [Seonamhaeicola sp. S2-3]
MSIIDKLKWRYATKKFNPTKTLTKNQLNTLKEAFNLTATSYGLQTVKMIVIQDTSLRESLLKHSYNQNQVVEASHLLVLCIQEKILEADVNKFFKNIQSIRNTPNKILDPYRLNLIDMLSNMTIKEQQQWSKNQAYIALGNLMTVCAVEGIDACPMEGFNPEGYDKALNLQEKGLKSVLLLPVGYRAEDDMFADFKKVRMQVTESVLEI